MIPRCVQSTCQAMAARPATTSNFAALRRTRHQAQTAGYATVTKPRASTPKTTAAVKKAASPAAPRSASTSTTASATAKKTSTKAAPTKATPTKPAKTTKKAAAPAVPPVQPTPRAAAPASSPVAPKVPSPAKPAVPEPPKAAPKVAPRAPTPPAPTPTPVSIKTQGSPDAESPSSSPITPASPEYKRAARKWTTTMIALPILLVTSYYLFDRLALGNQPKSLSRLWEKDPEAEQSGSEAKAPSA